MSNLWVINQSDTLDSESTMFVFEGTDDDVIELLAELVNKDKAANPNGWYEGADEPDKVECCGDTLYANATFNEYQIGYNAWPASRIRREATA